MKRLVDGSSGGGRWSCSPVGSSPPSHLLTRPTPSFQLTSCSIPAASLRPDVQDLARQQVVRGIRIDPVRRPIASASRCRRMLSSPLSRAHLSFLLPSPSSPFPRLKVLAPHLTTLTFNAHPSLELHSYSLSSTTLKTDSVHQIPDSAVKRDDKKERVTIDVEKSLGLKEGDELRLNLGWKAPLGGSMTVSPAVFGRFGHRQRRTRLTSASLTRCAFFLLSGLLPLDVPEEGHQGGGRVRSHPV